MLSVKYKLGPRMMGDSSLINPHPSLYYTEQSKVLKSVM
jgi:hypothetical protein